MGVTISRAAIADLEDLLPLIAAYRAFYQQRADERGERTFATEHLARGTSVVFLVRDARGRALGFVQLFPAFSTVYLGPSLILEDLYVDPSARRGGIATQLLQRAMEYAREVGATGMFLETAMDNVSAQKVYEAAGWTREGRFYKYNAPL